MSRTAATPLAPLVTRATLAQFWVRVQRADDGCWLWMGHVIPEGYGKFHVAATRQLVPAHRFAWVATHGRDPLPGMELDHLCRNRRCVNPDHLEEVSYRENVLRSNNPAAKNARKTHCKSGHPFDELNTYWRPDGKGKHCRECNRLRQAQLKQSRRAAS